MYEVMQEPGDLVFVPASSPHAVFNEEDITAMSMNYVDASNLWMYIHDLVASGEWESIEQFDVTKEPFGLSRKQRDMPYGEWKSSRRTWEGLVKKYRASKAFEEDPVPLWLD